MLIHHVRLIVNGVLLVVQMVNTRMMVYVLVHVQMGNLGVIVINENVNNIL